MDFRRLALPDEVDVSVAFDLAGDVAVVTMERPDRFNAIEATLGRGLVGAMARAGEESRAVAPDRVSSGNWVTRRDK